MLYIKVVHLISGLGKGGAETALYNLIRHKQADGELEYKVISLGGMSYYEEYIRRLGCELVVLSMKKHPISSFYSLVKEIKGCDLLCCWMYISNLIGYLAAKLSGIKKVVWFIRHADLDIENNKLKTLLFNRICARRSKSRIVKMVVYNGFLSRSIHENCGYDKSKSYIVNNGCDTQKYRYIPVARQKIIKELNLSEKNYIMLSCSRYDAIKDIPTFLKSVAEVKKYNGDTMGIMCGTDITQDNKELVGEIESAGLKIGKDIFLLGLRNDLPELFSASDVYVLHSVSEAFPNTLIQAMSCRIMCVTTDVGDVRRIIDGEYIVPIGDYKAVAEKVCGFMNKSKAELETGKERNAKSIAENFDITKVVLEYERVIKLNGTEN